MATVVANTALLVPLLFVILGSPAQPIGDPGGAFQNQNV